MKHKRQLQKIWIRVFSATLVAIVGPWLAIGVVNLVNNSAGTGVVVQASVATVVSLFVVIFVLSLISQWITARVLGRRRYQERHFNSDEADADIDDDDREDGTVKWFSRDRGYGFIVRDNEEEVFVHFRAIRGRGHRKYLREGQQVKFGIADGENGKPKAVNVSIVSG